MIEVDAKATGLYGKLKDQEPTNCQVIAERITKFELTMVLEKVRAALDRMHDFFVTSFEGYWCSICEAKYHAFFDVDKKAIKFDHKFGREILRNTFHVLIYFHVHIPRISDLLSRFIVSCNSNGEFEYKTINPEHIFPKTSDLFDSLESCWSKRNMVNYYEECKSISSKFNIMNFHEFFQPYLDKFGLYTEFLENSLR